MNIKCRSFSDLELHKEVTNSFVHDFSLLRELKLSTGYRNRTDKILRSGDFKSPAFAYFANPALFENKWNAGDSNPEPID
jgi:hypothetical protein